MARQDRLREATGGVEIVLFQNGTGRYFGLKQELIHIDVWAGGVDAACCGVNLAFAGFGVSGFSCVSRNGPGKHFRLGADRIHIDV